MNPQGSSIVDNDYFDRLIAQVNKVDACQELQALVDRLLPSLEGQTTAIASELAALTPVLALLSANPANLPGVITFLTDFISLVLTPQLKPTITYASQLTLTATKIAELTVAITEAAGRIEGCSVTI